MQLLSTYEAAEVLKLTPRQVQYLCAKGQLGQRIGKGRYVISSDELRQFAKIPRKPGRKKGYNSNGHGRLRTNPKKAASAS